MVCYDIGIVRKYSELEVEKGPLVFPALLNYFSPDPRRKSRNAVM